MSRMKNYLRQKLSIEKNKVLKFSVSKPNMWLLITFTIIALIAYSILSYYESNLSIAVMSDASLADDYRSKMNFFQVSKNLLVVFASVFATSIMSTFLVDIKTQNHTISDLLANDVFASQDFYNTLTEENKANLMENLEKNIYFNNNSIAESMYKSMKDSINDLSKESFYYESCTFDITCKVEGEYFVKNIVKSFRLKTFKGNRCHIKVSFNNLFIYVI